MTDPIIYKTCNRCKQSKAIDEFYRRSDRSPQSRNRWCKACYRITFKNPDALPVPRASQLFCPATHKMCSRCKTVLSIFDFRWRRNKKQRSAFNCWCKQCELDDRRRAWREMSSQAKQKRYTYHREYMQTPAGQRLSKAAELRRREDPERHRLRMIKQRKGYIEKHYGITLEVYTELLDAQAGVCAICSRR